ncbi:TPA: NHLP family bacteriocin export ABC transporter peptidase/permease/ATPase subunit [Legionella pneumophila]|nr:NHLP family bacteriocin export ABC transporter peptidase/permease/ATPase subunit [Legionella pneumophila]
MARVQTPTMIQMEATECGAVALGIILGYYGCFLPLEELRVACGVGRDGSKAVNMLKAARKYGLTASGAQSDLESLREVKPPFIIFWEFNHFIVVEGIINNKVYINDPATGPRSISLDALNKGYTGVLLIFEPTDKLVKHPRLQLIQTTLTEPFLSNKPAFILILLAGLFLLIPGIIIPGFSKIFIDNILIQNMKGWFYPLILGLLVAMLLQISLVYIQQYVLLKLKVKMILTSGANLIWHVLHLPMQFFYQRYAGDVGDRINANDRISDLLSNDLTGSVVGLVNMAFFAIILFIINWQLACVACITALLNCIVLTRVARNIEDKTREFLQQCGRLTGMEMSSLQMIETIKATSMEDEFFKRWSTRHAQIIDLGQKIAFFNQVLIVIPQFLTGLSNVIILTLGSWLIMQGHLTVGSLVAFQSLIIQFNAPLTTLLKLGNNIQQIRGDLLRINDVLQYKKDEIIELNQANESMNLGESSIQVTATDLVFAYSELSSPIIHHLNLDIASGKHVALIGRTGSGKSTIAKLFMNLYKPQVGKILFNGYDIRTIPNEILANSITMVEQDIFLFEGSIRDNLTLWDSQITDQRLIESLKTAELYNELLPRGGLNCHLLEGGTNLSGGQRQRLEIARSLVKNPKLLVLDEATSALDPLVEKKIFDNLRQYDITLIIITHRLSAIKDMDEIIMLDQGTIIHRGTHEQLLQINAYNELIQLEGH